MKTDQKQKRLKLPTRCRPLGVEYKIEYVSDLKADDVSLSGQVAPHTKIIEICTTANTTIEEILSTVFHEYIHALLFQSGVSSIINNDDLEEGIVVLLENTLAEHIKQKSGMFTHWKEIDIKAGGQK